MSIFDPVLIGSTYPLSLIRRSVTITPTALGALRQLLQTKSFSSFWGHRNTLHVANALLGVDVSPSTERPALNLTADNFPTLNGVTFRICYVLSPDYIHGFRPQIGEEVTSDKITGWQVLEMVWNDCV